MKFLKPTKPTKTHVDLGLLQAKTNAIAAALHTMAETEATLIDIVKQQTDTISEITTQLETLNTFVRDEMENALRDALRTAMFTVLNEHQQKGKQH